MPGSPIMRKRMRELDKLGEAFLFDQLAAGKTMSKLVGDMHLSKRVWYKWLHAAEGRYERYQAARKQWADQLAEETLDIADGAEDAHDAQVRRLRIDTRKWLASRVSPESWGDTRRDPLLTINIQDQHLGALRELSIEQDAIEHSDDVTDVDDDE